MSIFKRWSFIFWIVFAVLWLFAFVLARMVYHPSSDLGRFALFAFAGFAALLIVGALGSRMEKRAHRETQVAADSYIAVTSKPALDAWQQLGTDPQEREQSINRMFDAQVGTVEFDTMWEFDYSHTNNAGATETGYSSMSFRIARDLAAMDKREREFLRAAYLLYNAGLIDSRMWREFTFCLVYGDGKASIISCEYREPIELPFRDESGAIQYYADHHHSTVESAVSSLCLIIENHAQKPDVAPVVQMLKNRVSDGSV